MDIRGYLKKGIATARLRGEAAEELAADPESFVPALVFFAVPTLVIGTGALLSFAVRMHIEGRLVVGGIVAVVALSFLGPLFNTFVLHLSSRLFGGEGRYLDYYQALGIASLVAWGTMIPFIGILFAVWQVPVTVVVTARVQKLSTGRAVAAVLLPAALAVLLVVLVISMGVMAAFLGLKSSGGMQGM